MNEDADLEPKSNRKEFCKWLYNQPKLEWIKKGFTASILSQFLLNIIRFSKKASELNACRHL
jgi:hypothetical protein